MDHTQQSNARGNRKGEEDEEEVVSWGGRREIKDQVQVRHVLIWESDVRPKARGAKKEVMQAASDDAHAICVPLYYVV